MNEQTKPNCWFNVQVMAFPDSFTWGVSTAAYQIEGAYNEDGRGPTIWDMRSHTPGRVWNGHTGDVACDHYHRYKEDVALMKGLGINGYRFSVAWSRIQPEGFGPVNSKGLDFYDRLVDELVAAGITPWCTCYHWDLPLGLHYRGGWMNPDIPKYFADYVQIISEKLGDRIKNWFTFNEPQVFVGYGLLDDPRPGEQRFWNEVTHAAHNILLSHGRAVQVIRSTGSAETRVGMAPVGITYVPNSDSPEDIEAARLAMFEVHEPTQWQNSLWMDPMFFGRYPEHYEKVFTHYRPNIGPDDMAIISQPVDFLAVNTYSAIRVKANKEKGWENVTFGPETPLTAYNWFVEPSCLYWGPKFYYERYKVPIYMTENGLSSMDWVSLDGKVHDPNRIDYLHRHLRELKRSIADGTDVQGYFQWSMLDNFEWSEGYKERFGLIYVDMATGQRTPKDSYDWYKRVIATNGAEI